MINYILTGNKGESLRYAREYLGWSPVDENWFDFYFKNFSLAKKDEKELPCSLKITNQKKSELITIQKFINREALFVREDSLSSELEDIKIFAIALIGWKNERVIVPCV